MTDSPPTALRRTPLHARHVAAGARLAPYAGWEMPLHYTGIADEHRAVRSSAGLFDVSHMGEIEIAGRAALELVQHVSGNDAGRLQVGQAQYSVLLTPEGTCRDDVLVYRIAPTHFMLVVNAANVEQDYAWIAGHTASVGEAAVVDSSSRYALLALQGPASPRVLQPLTGIDLAAVRPFGFAYGEVASARVIVSRTGYTGEDGFEIFVPPATVDRVWQALLDAGRDVGVKPCGLGARDTLRLEAGMRLHGADIDETTTALEAGLGWTIGWEKPAFIGREALLGQRAQGVSTRLVGLEILDPGIARAGCRVLSGGEPVGRVTSGTRTPSLDHAIAMAYVPDVLAAPGTPLHVDVRGRPLAARVVRMPFYVRPAGC